MEWLLEGLRNLEPADWFILVAPFAILAIGLLTGGLDER